MSRMIEINGIRLDKLPMPLESYSNKTPATQTLPLGEIRCTRREGTLRLILPPYLSVELYRAGILPQDVNTSVEISIGGRPVGRYLVSDVRYPMWSYSPFGGVTFTLTCVLEENPIPAGVKTLSQAGATQSTTYVTDMSHYLDEAGELAQLPRPARRLASFLTLLIEAATGAPSADEHDSGIRCIAKDCRGTVRTALPSGQVEILWRCKACGHKGVIKNWNDTKWNQLKRIEETE
jgi:hypothetical protein